MLNSAIVQYLIIRFVCCSIFCRLAIACDKLKMDSSSLSIPASVLTSICDIIKPVDETILCECESGIVTSSNTFSIIKQGSVSESNISVESDSLPVCDTGAIEFGSFRLTVCFAAFFIA